MGMRHIISLNEILDTVQVDRDKCEVWASADAYYDEAHSQVAVELEAGVRPRNSRVALHQAVKDWCERKESIKESVARAEAVPVVRDIFDNWVRKLRQNPLQPSTH